MNQAKKSNDALQSIKKKVGNYTSVTVVRIVMGSTFDMIFVKHLFNSQGYKMNFEH